MPVTPQNKSELPAQKQALSQSQPPHRRIFWKAAVLGTAALVPVLACIIWVLRGLGPTPQSDRYLSYLIHVAIFAGLPVFVTAGGLTRHVVDPRVPGRLGPLRRAALLYGLAGVALTVLAALPLSALPMGLPRWAILLGVGGIVIGGVGMGLCWLFVPRPSSPR